jgi:hypothetical protein
MTDIKHDVFLQNLKHKNILFYIALHFCAIKYRSKVAALVGLYTQWTGLFKRIKEPLAIQMRLAWWQEQCTKTCFSANTPPEIMLLKQYSNQIGTLLTTIEYEFLHQDPDYHGQSASVLFTLIADIMSCDAYKNNAGAYGLFYGLCHNHNHNHNNNNQTRYPTVKLPFGLRFLRIPIILQHKQNALILLYRLIKNFLI